MVAHRGRSSRSPTRTPRLTPCPSWRSWRGRRWQSVCQRPLGCAPRTPLNSLNAGGCDRIHSKEDKLMTDIRATWQPYEEHGRLTTRSDLPDSAFAFPAQRKEPLTDAQHVRNAVARFDQVIDVSNEDRALALPISRKQRNISAS